MLEETLPGSFLATRSAVPPILDGWTLAVPAAAALPARLCAEHLARLGARRVPAATGRRDTLTLYAEAGGVEGVIGASGTEALAQAVSGLMAVHGRDQRRPRRLGLEVASVAAGVVAAQGMLAALLSARRGHPVARVETSVLQASLLFLYHHLAIATCTEPADFPDPEPSPGPPFCTADGHWFELEMLSYKAWLAFWKQLGVAQTDLLEAWLAFVYRYTAGRCALPEELHEVTRRHSLEALRRTAEACGAALCRVRTYPELLAERAEAALPFDTPWTIEPGASASLGGPGGRAAAGAPLAGLRVVESTSRLQGPLASHLLRLLGAEVVKLEPPGGDFTRSSPPLAGELGAAYLAYNRGKQVVEVDYKQPEGRARILDLVAGADVFLHNWRSGRAEKLGFDGADLATINPGLVYAHASGWGRAGAEPAPIAGDFLVQAHAGCGEGLNPIDEPPFPSRVTLVDVIGGLVACEGILAGLYLREQTGSGCRVDTSLLAGAMMLQAEVLRDAAAGQETRRQQGRPLWGPLDRPLETTDGVLMVDAADAPARRRLAETCRVEPEAEAADEQIAAQLQDRPAAAWEPLLRAAEVPAAVVCEDLATVPGDPRMAGLLERVNDACWAPAAPWRFAE